MESRLFSSSLFFFLFFISALAHHNITVDDQNPSVYYSGLWTNMTNSLNSFNGSYMATIDPEAHATFTFLGQSIRPPLFTSF